MDGIPENTGSGRGVRLALVLLPLLLLISAAGAVWWHWVKETEEDLDPGLAMGGEGIERAEVEDLVEKLGWLNAEGWESEEGKKGVHQRMAFIAGTLSPQNYGFLVRKGAEVSFEGELWPMLWVDVEGVGKKGEVVVLATAYNGSAGNVTSLLTVARAVKDLELERTVRLLFSAEILAEGVEVLDAGGFVKEGERCVACLVLSLGDSGEAVAKVVGDPLVAEIEEGFGSVDGVLRVETSDEPDGLIGRVYGEALKFVGLRVSVSGEAEGSEGVDLVMRRARVLVDLVKASAVEGGE